MLPKTCDAAIPVMVHGGNSHAWQAYLDAPLDDMLMRCLILCVRSHDFSWKCTKYASCSHTARDISVRQNAIARFKCFAGTARTCWEATNTCMAVGHHESTVQVRVT